MFKDKSIISAANILANGNWMLSQQDHVTLVKMLGVYMENPKAFDLNDPEDAIKAITTSEGMAFIKGSPDIAPTVDTQTGLMAIISVGGIICKNPSPLGEKILGMTDIDNIGYALDDAFNDPAVSAITIVLDSPGGEITGLEELARKISAIDAIKPVYAFTDSKSASASYWIMSMARKVGMTNSARVGSIGILNYKIYSGKQLEKDGVEITAFASGKHKLMSQDFYQLTDEEKKIKQAEVDKLGAQFKETVLSKRPNATQEVLESALVYDGEDALKNNLVDYVTDSLDEFLAMVATDKSNNMKVITQKVAQTETAPNAIAKVETPVATDTKIETIAPAAKADDDQEEDGMEVCLCDACKAVFKRAMDQDDAKAKAIAPAAASPAAPAAKVETQVASESVVAPAAIVADPVAVIAPVAAVAPVETPKAQVQDFSNDAWMSAKGFGLPQAVSKEVQDWRDAINQTKQESTKA